MEHRKNPRLSLRTARAQATPAGRPAARGADTDYWQTGSALARAARNDVDRPHLSPASWLLALAAFALIVGGWVLVMVGMIATLPLLVGAGSWLLAAGLVALVWLTFRADYGH